MFSFISWCETLCTHQTLLVILLRFIYALKLELPGFAIRNQGSGQVGGLVALLTSLSVASVIKNSARRLPYPLLRGESRFMFYPFLTYWRCTQKIWLSIWRIFLSLLLLLLRHSPLCSFHYVEKWLCATR